MGGGKVGGELTWGGQVVIHTLQENPRSAWWGRGATAGQGPGESAGSWLAWVLRVRSPGAPGGQGEPAGAQR